VGQHVLIGEDGDAFAISVLGGRHGNVQSRIEPADDREFRILN